ncbi:hypothetical protein SAMN05661086_00886 [Anaeromicropila populeti]|uniref:Uncharacterized protein n=1 Tax=Anaeromicropila populeti TaxID=37658 RepID=A0A1I6ILY6_9FIRM|nr:hypothetical protein SAMN05661086_00886 [Anaeromicropila populeti]
MTLEGSKVCLLPQEPDTGSPQEQVFEKEKGCSCSSAIPQSATSLLHFGQ